MKVHELLEGTVSNSFGARLNHKQTQKKLAAKPEPTADDKLNDPEMLALRKKMKKMTRRLKSVK